MADEEEVVADEPTEEPTELEILTEISNDIKYLIKCLVPLSVYVDFEFPTDDSSEEES